MMLHSASLPALAQPQAPLTIPDTLRTCTVNDDCMLVENLCSVCCDYDAISKASLEDFNLLRNNHCPDKTTKPCECTEQDLEPVCTENRCTAFNPYADEDGNVSYE
jgi:hypothetical protein